jgi:hypothetical protein
MYRKSSSYVTVPDEYLLLTPPSSAAVTVLPAPGTALRAFLLSLNYHLIAFTQF